MPESWHGTPSGYCYHRCRCDACREAWRVYHRARRPGRPDGGLGTLAAAIAARGDVPGEYIRVPFLARLDGEPVQVTAVLQRTAVYHAGDICDRHIARLDCFWVDAGGLEWARIRWSGRRRAGR